MRAMAGRARTGDLGGQPHPRWWRCIDASPSWRDPRAALSSPRSLRCRACGRELGVVDDPVVAVLTVWQHRREAAYARSHSWRPVPGA